MSFLDFAPFLDWSYNLRQTTDKSQHWTFRFDYVHPPFISMWLEQNSTLETLNQGKRGSGSPKPMFSSQYVLLHTTTTFKFASILSCASLSKFLCGQDFRSLQYFVISQIKIKTFIFGHLSQSSFKQNLVFLGLDRPMVWLLLFMMRVYTTKLFTFHILSRVWHQFFELEAENCSFEHLFTPAADLLLV